MKMRLKVVALLTAVAALSLAGLALAHDMPGMGDAASAPPATQPAPQPDSAAIPAVDLCNTLCPVSGDKVEDSKLVEVYDGKVYHLCCADCRKAFEKNPAKYAKAVAEDPAKFGVK